MRKKLTRRQTACELTPEDDEGKEEVDRRRDQSELTDPLFEVEASGVDGSFAALAVLQLALDDASWSWNPEFVGCLMKPPGGVQPW